MAILGWKLSVKWVWILDRYACVNLKKRVEREFPLCLKENYPKQDLIMEIVSSLGIDIVPESIVVSPHLIRYFSYKMFQNWDPLRHIWRKIEVFNCSRNNSGSWFTLYMGKIE